MPNLFRDDRSALDVSRVKYAGAAVNQLVDYDVAQFSLPIRIMAVRLFQSILVGPPGSRRACRGDLSGVAQAPLAPVAETEASLRSRLAQAAKSAIQHPVSSFQHVVLLHQHNKSSWRLVFQGAHVQVLQLHAPVAGQVGEREKTRHPCAQHFRCSHGSHALTIPSL